MAQRRRFAEKARSGRIRREKVGQRTKVFLGKDPLDGGVEEAVVGEHVGVVPPACLSRPRQQQEAGEKLGASHVAR